MRIKSVLQLGKHSAWKRLVTYLRQGEAEEARELYEYAQQCRDQSFQAIADVCPNPTEFYVVESHDAVYLASGRELSEGRTVEDIRYQRQVEFAAKQKKEKAAQEARRRRNDQMTRHAEKTAKREAWLAKEVRRMKQIVKKRNLEAEYRRLKTYIKDADEVTQPKRETIPDDVRIFVWRRDRGTCVRCGGQSRLEFDHIIPLSKGGSNRARNLQLLCESCNRSKNDHI